MVSIAKKVGKLGGGLFYGWWVVACGSLLGALGIGAIHYGFNAFFTPMVNEFGWSRSLASGAFSLSRLEGGVEGVILGPLIDKFGARMVAFFGVIAAGAGFVALLLVNGNIITLYVVFGVFLSMGYGAFAQRATYAAAARWFIRKRSRAFAFITVGQGIGGSVFVPLLAWMITQYGWRTAAVTAGLMLLVLGLPAAFSMRSSPEPMGLLPDGETSSKADETVAGRKESVKLQDAGPHEVDFTIKEALRTQAFWVYTVAMSLRSWVLSAIVVHQIPYLTDIGIDYTAAAGVLGMMLLASVPARLLFGWIGDFFPKKLLLFIACALMALGVWIFIHATSLGMLYVFVVVYGLGHGGALPVMHAIRGDLFGSKAFATIAGVSSIVITAVTVASPIVTGYLYDVSHSYVLSFYIMLVTVALAGVVFLFIKKPKPPIRLTQPTGH